MTYSKQFTFYLFLVFLFPAGLFSQKGLTVDDLAEWRRITDRAVSDDGKWVAARISPWEGDGTVNIYDSKGEKVAAYHPADKFTFSSSSRYLLVSRVPPKELTDSLKVNKTKKEKMPMNSLVIRSLPGSEEVLDSIRSYKLAEKEDWLAYQQGQKDSTLYIRSLDGQKKFQFHTVSEFGFAKKSGRMYYLSAGDSLGVKAGLYAFDPGKGLPTLVKEGKEVFKHITFNEEGDKLAFLYCPVKDSAYKSLDLFLSANGGDAELIVERNNDALPKGWVISENGNIMFSKDSRRLFFYTSPEPRQKDTTILAENRPDVQVWSWDEPTQYTVQNYNKDKDLKKSYQAVYHLTSKKAVQLATRETPDISLPQEGNGDVAILSTYRPYSLSSMWEGHTRRDIYAVSLETGEKHLIKKGDYGMPRISPSGKYAAWYAETDSSWYAIDLSSRKEYRLTTPASFPAWDETNDVPDYPKAYGLATWTADDKYILIYDRYDIWRFDPQGASSPVRLTTNGRENGITYRLIRLDKEEKFIDVKKPQIMSGFNTKTKGWGYYRSTFSSPAAPSVLLAGDFMLKDIDKAKNSDIVLYSKETFGQYPELRLSDLSFRKDIVLTNEGEQQNGFKWGTAELVSWTSLDGKPLQGVVFKPTNFDPSRKYPLIVNFYERSSDGYYNYRMPQPHRSTVDYHLYTSNDYIIFNPDVVYETGYPGESCYNCVMPGIMKLIGEGFIDEKAIGAQGHSWGGYQVAYLATRTNLFAAIESGAPVVNMFSAYGGIRWGSGLNRSFQYEHTQSRIGGTPWTDFPRFLENSPLFTMDKVETPILIMHNDADGHVPWYQGIEYFIALKRLQKPVWMLNYTGEPHWPQKNPNIIDFQKRMFQFFNHYLKKEPMPKWMKEGLPVIDRDFELGY